MKLHTLDAAPVKPVVHNPELKKRLLVAEGFSCIRHVSHIVLVPGDTAVAHTHDEGYEVFYFIRGRIVFDVNGKEVAASAGSCLIIEPGEVHAIVNCIEETETIYFFAVR